MRLIGRNKLDRLRGSGEPVETWLSNWATEIRNANWKHPMEVTEQFPTTRRTGDGYFEFSIGSCGWVVQLLISFPQGVALVTDLKFEE